MTARPTLLTLEPAQLEAYVVAAGGRPFHARVIRREVLERGVLDYGAMTGLPGELRRKLAEELPVLAGRELDSAVSRDHTTKLLIGFPRADSATEDAVETVHIPPRDPRSPKGATLCVSTQVGCPVECPFCASGRDGLVRNLETHEILEQFVRGRAIGKLSRCVVMGIGEPLLNYARLSKALDVVHDEMGLGSRKVTVSTVGFPDRLRRIAPTKPRFQLAISLHTPDDSQRDELVPAMAGTPIADVLAAGDDWFAQTGREVTYEYVLLAGRNDTPEHAARLAERLRGRRCTVNLIPFNPVEPVAHPGLPAVRYERPTDEAVASFESSLRRAGLVVTIRWSRGLEDAAACGQLRARALDR